MTFAEFEIDEATGDIIDDAVYKRNQLVQERLGVSFEFVEGPGAWAGHEEFAKNVSSSTMAGDGAYDIVAGYSLAMTSLAADKVLCDLAATKYIDFSKPWWSDKLLNEATINGKLYIASGDIATSMLYYMYGTFYNKKILEEFQLEDPCELALSGGWTLDKLIEMSTGVYSDLNGNGTKDSDDRFGFECYNVYVDPFYFASGLKLTELDKNGVPVASKDLSSEKAADLLTKLSAFLYDSDDAIFIPNSDPYYLFADGNYLFANQELLFAATKLRNSKFDYGVLPIPKYDENQEDYCTVVSFPMSLIGIPMDAKDPDMSSAVMELLASGGYKYSSPALFEVALKVKYSSDDNTAKVFDIIKSSVSFDFGRIFTSSINGSLGIELRGAMEAQDTNWASRIASKLPAYEAGLEEFVSNFQD